MLLLLPQGMHDVIYCLNHGSLTLFIFFDNIIVTVKLSLLQLDPCPERWLEPALCKLRVRRNRLLIKDEWCLNEVEVTCVL